MEGVGKKVAGLAQGTLIRTRSFGVVRGALLEKDVATEGQGWHGRKGIGSCYRAHKEEHKRRDLRSRSQINRVNTSF